MNEQRDPMQNRNDEIQFGELPPPTQKDLSGRYAIAAICLSVAAFCTFFCCCASLTYTLILGFLLSALAITMAILSVCSHPGHKMPLPSVFGLLLAVVYLFFFVILLAVVLIAKIQPDFMLDFLNQIYMDAFNMSFEEFFYRIQSLM